MIAIAGRKHSHLTLDRHQGVPSRVRNLVRNFPMKSITRALALAVPVIVMTFAGQMAAQATAVSQSQAATQAGLPSEMPAKFEPATASFDYTRRDVMIPMRDGVKLHTVILVPRNAKR